MIAQIILTIALLAAVIFCFYRRSKKLKEMEMEERLRDIYR